MKDMKSIFLTLIIAFAITSCKKSEEYKTISLSQILSQNQSYQFVLPLTDDSYSIIQDASHAKISMIGKDASGDIIYSYAPAADYIGNDQIVLQTSHEEYNHKRGEDHHASSDKNKNHGDCDNDSLEKEDDFIVTINIQIIPLAQSM